LSVLGAGNAQAQGDAAFDFGEADFDLPRAQWHFADYQMKNPLFDTDFSADNIVVAAGLKLEIVPKKSRGNGFDGASIRRQKTSGFGRYEAIIKPAVGAGVVTGFFTYTGPSYGTKHDEIDIEFLGKDTTILNIAWFVDGKLAQRQLPLGFDAAEKFHRYAFEWSPDRIAWFVDGDMIFEHTIASGPVPQIPGRLFANIWVVDEQLENWAGAAAANTQAVAEFRMLKFAPLKELPEFASSPNYFSAASGS